MAKLVNAIDSKSIVPCGLVGSNPTFGKERRYYGMDGNAKVFYIYGRDFWTSIGVHVVYEKA